MRDVFIKDERERLGLQLVKVLGASWGIFCAVTSKLDLPRTTPLHDLAATAKKASTERFAATDGNHGLAVAYMAKLLSTLC